MPPGYISTLEHYWVWLEKEIVSAGAQVVGQWGDLLVVEPIPAIDDEWTGLAVPFQRLVLGAVQLDFRFTIDAAFQPLTYTYQLWDTGHQFLWRKDKGPGHDELGPAHIHRGYPEAAPVPFPEVELDEILEEIHDYVERGRLP